MKDKIRWFDRSLLWLGIVAGSAWLFPELGSKEGWLQVSLLIKIGVVWIFFSQGVELGWRNFWLGLHEWKLHLFVQLFSFVIMPLTMSLVVWGALNSFPSSIKVGLLFLSILPTTIATSALMAARAGGKAAAVNWNILFSNVLGLFIVPYGTLWILGLPAEIEVPYFAMTGQVFLLLLLPMILGMMLQQRLGEFWQKHLKLFKTFNKLLIYLMVYAALCDGFISKSWEILGLNFLIGLVGVVLAMLLFWHGLAWKLTGWLGFSPELRVSAVFTAAQKTLAAGVPLAGLLFTALAEVGAGASLPPLALFLLPLLIYHPMQLILGAVLVEKIQGKGRKSI